jgi:transcriptional regulator with XRE-family HTH domain
MGYHYGQTIREYREKKSISMAKLASMWPSKEEGVTSRYVSDIERGKKHISDITLLRELAKMLDIPLWKFGLSEYNPFQEEIEDISVFYNIDSLEQLIEDTWLIRQTVTMVFFAEKVDRLSAILEGYIRTYPLIKDNKDFLRLLAHSKRLEEVVFTERKHFDISLKCAYEMLSLACISGDMIAQAIAYTRIGVELLRDDDRNALEYLQKACDMSLSLTKEVRAYCFAMLARGHAQFGDYGLFERTIDVAINCGDCMMGQAVACKNYIYHAYSAILEEKSNGYILFGQGANAIATLPDVEKEVSRENNSYLKMWLPLDYAQAYLLQEEVEESLRYLQIFYESTQGYNSERITSKIQDHLKSMCNLGYGELPEVKNFQEMYHSK